MVHYNVWFSFKAGVDTRQGLAVVGSFLQGLCASGEVAGVRILKNQSAGERTKLLEYHAVVEFADHAALAIAMKHQEARGIHEGGHGRILAVVSGFHAEVFEVLTQFRPAIEPRRLMDYACDI